MIERRWAMHEACHAVLAKLLGLKIVSCHMGSVGSRNGMLPHCLLGLEVDDGAEPTKEQLRAGVIAAIGPMAVYGLMADSSDYDIKMALKWAEQAVGLGMANKFVAAQILVARQMIRENIHIIKDVTEKLQADEEITDGQVQEMIDSAVAVGQPA